MLQWLLVDLWSKLLSHLKTLCSAIQVSAAVLTEQNVKILQSVIPMLDADVNNVDSGSAQTFGTIRALNLVFHHVTVPPELQAKLNLLLEKANSISLITPKEGKQTQGSVEESNEKKN